MLGVPSGDLLLPGGESCVCYLWCWGRKLVVFVLMYISQRICFLFLEARGGVSGLWADGADAQPLCSGPGTGCCGFGSVLRPWGEKVRQSPPSALPLQQSGTATAEWLQNPSAPTVTLGSGGMYLWTSSPLCWVFYFYSFFSRDVSSFPFPPVVDKMLSEVLQSSPT